MGYESKLYFKNKYGIEICNIDMCKMGYDNGWRELFKTEYEKGLYVGFGGMGLTTEQQQEWGCEEIPDIEIHRDRYGDTLKYCDIEDLYQWCKVHKNKMDYSMLDLLYKITKELRKKDKYGEIVVVHFGY